MAYMMAVMFDQQQRKYICLWGHIISVGGWADGIFVYKTTTEANDK